MASHAFESHELSSFLREKRCSSSSEASMTGMGDMKGKWFISDDDYPFVKKSRPMAFVEQPRKGLSKPLVVDLDFKYPSETGLVRAFTLDQVRSFCRLLVDGLKTFFSVQEFEELRFFVTLRPGPYSGKSERKDGVHILCPDIGLGDDKQKVLREWVMKQNGVASCFTGTGYKEDDNIYDGSTCHKQGWIFYGESKPNIQPYALAAIYSYVPVEDTWRSDPIDSFTPLQLMEMLSVRYKIPVDDNIVLEESKDEYNRLLSPPMWTQAVAEDSNAIVPMNPLLQVLVQHHSSRVASEEEKTIVGKFVMNCLTAARAENYDTWKRVGWCLNNIEASEDMLKVYLAFSAKSSKASENNMADIRRDWFVGMRKSGDGPRLTERSLRKWARDDNPEEYKRIIEEYVGEYIRTNLEPTHHHVAKLMKKMYGSTYIASVKPRDITWHKYDENINMWKKMNQGIEIRLKLSSEVALAIIQAKASYYQKLQGNPSTELKQMIDSRNMTLHKVETSLYSSGFIDSTMKMAVNQFYEEDFEQKLNADPSLFGCRNGILELRAPGDDGRPHAIFRSGRPEDYVSFLAGQTYKAQPEPIEYHPYDPADPRQAEITDFFTKLFPNEELRRYVLRLLSSCLEGENREQCFYIATGVGGNGKSKLVDLMRMTMGDYQTSLQTTVLTRHRPDSGAANPDMIVAKRRRFIYLQEPDPKEPINTARMKQFSGEDIVEARGLYEEQDKFTITGKLFMMCNDMPPVNSMDRGTWRRIRVLKFESKFMPPGEYERAVAAGKPNVFPQDPKMEEKLVSWREPFLALLVHIYENEYIPLGLNPIPAAVMAASEKYKKDFDVYARFRAERIRLPITPEEKLEAHETPVSASKIRQVLAAWKKETKSESLSAQDVLGRILDEFGEPDARGWPGMKIFASDEEAANWDLEHSA